LTITTAFGLRATRKSKLAWRYLEAHKEKYGLSKIIRPQKVHFAYSVYFREPGGNHLEIEYYPRAPWERTARRDSLGEVSLRSSIALR